MTVVLKPSQQQGLGTVLWKNLPKCCVLTAKDNPNFVLVKFGDYVSTEHNVEIADEFWECKLANINFAKDYYIVPLDNKNFTVDLSVTLDPFVNLKSINAGQCVVDSSLQFVYLVGHRFVLQIMTYVSSDGYVLIQPPEGLFRDIRADIRVLPAKLTIAY